MFMRRKKGFGFEFVPNKRARRLGLPKERRIANVGKWTKKRATIEAKFFINTYKVRFGKGGKGYRLKKFGHVRVVRL